MAVKGTALSSEATRIGSLALASFAGARRRSPSRSGVGWKKLQSRATTLAAVSPVSAAATKMRRGAASAARAAAAGRGRSAFIEVAAVMTPDFSMVEFTR